jgi:hypothetical protein
MAMHLSVWDYERVTGSKAHISEVIPAKGDLRSDVHASIKRVALEDTPSAPLRKY